MNRQPFGIPPRWWEPKLSPTWVKMTRRYRWRKLRKLQRLVGVETKGIEYVRDAIDAGHGVLITPNHSAHYDSAALYVALDEISQPVFFMTAWQVFGMSSRFDRWLMQRMGCFSIDREGTDRQAFKQAVEVLQREPHPLVIFPEGDIYHVSDRVTQFREGAGAIALAAAKRADREIVVVPCGIKFRYVEDPTDDLLQFMGQLEERVFLQPRPALPLTERIHRVAEAVLAIKEIDYLGGTRAGPNRERIGYLADTIVSRMETDLDVKANGDTIPERVKIVRQSIIKKAESSAPENGEEFRYDKKLESNMEDLFFVIQLYSYPGDYLQDNPSIERIAETLDKLEEDVFGAELPSVRGRRKVDVHFGDPIPVESDRQRRQSSAELTQTMQTSVQSLLDAMDRARAGAAHVAE